jgi:hypothetical protein
MIDAKTIAVAVETREQDFPGRALRYHKLHDANLQYSEDHWKELQRMYPGKSIIILNEKVIYSSNNHDKLLKAIESLTPEEREVMHWEYIPQKSELLLGANICVLDLSQISMESG